MWALSVALVNLLASAVIYTEYLGAVQAEKIGQIACVSLWHGDGDWWNLMSEKVPGMKDEKGSDITDRRIKVHRTNKENRTLTNTNTSRTAATKHMSWGSWERIKMVQSMQKLWCQMCRRAETKYLCDIVTRG